MSDKYFVDTNILIYAHDALSGTKYDQASSLLGNLWQKGNGVLSTQVLQEFCVTMQRKLAPQYEFSELRSLLFAFLAWEVVANTPDSALSALEIGERYKISFWDALILCAAERAEAETVYSEDFQHGRLYGGVRVINPFFG